MLRLLIALIFPLACFLSCTAPKALHIHSLHLNEQHVLLLPDSAEAAKTIVTDRTDRFFERVTLAEMAIQMKSAPKADITRAELLPAYKQYLQGDVETFSAQESQMVASVLQDVFNNCKAVSGSIFPDTLVLIKTKGNHYGASVYYTRENYIIIPEDVLGKEQQGDFASTMYHELFHVYSRLHPAQRARLYRLIGFESMGYDKLRLPAPLAARVLHNPDGADFAQKITLKTGGGKTVEAIPVLYSNEPGFVAGKREFFSYVEFNLFAVEKTKDDHWQVLTQADGYSSTLDLKNLPDFFRQIKDNTGYIIHPDEVLADNFSFLVRTKNDARITARFSEGGKKLLEEMEGILK